MREIKFRALRNKVWYYFDLKDRARWARELLDTMAEDENLIEFEAFVQYTGLKDKNKEIYEGDIVNLIPDGYIRELATVEWDDNNASWIYRRISELELVNKSGVFVKWKPVEVIGNIYEHPALLAPEQEGMR